MKKNKINGFDVPSENIIKDLDAPIYKYMPLKYVMQLLLAHELYVGKVSDWEDVYENFGFRSNFQDSSKRSLSAESLIKHCFGQSWTSAAETDAMWRIYSDIYHGELNDALANVAVRIQTTVRKLFSLVYVNNDCMATTFIRKVQYMPLASIYDWVSNMDYNKVRPETYMIKSQFMKREEFLHENEVRLIIFNPDVEDEKLIFKLDSCNFIDEFMIDPRLINTSAADEIKYRLVSYGASKSKIKVSHLYDFQPCQTPIVVSY